ncbi:MAG: DUF1232 domain-containing protein [Candidatus Eisenbacteria bacterium]|uniref:DUF1232 domain-containing protein n=1 Tax=Eiseniibacteriota bacterium TaxID=2212470 RepID=A0A538SQ76_UNCEI|nr:MAG: DUF1232 domain-containing protein [Candidatus Eisenbacteria bacterium]
MPEPHRKPDPLTRLRARVRALEADTYALYLAARDPRVPWPAKAVAAITVAYALSPIDLIPDFIPVIGHLDDLVLVPLGLALAIRLIPPPILAEHRAEAARRFAHGGPRSRVGIVLVAVVWLLGLVWLARVFWSRAHHR